MQANIFNQADRLFKLDQNGNAAVTYGVSAATGVFNTNVGINEGVPQEKLHLSAVNAKVEGGTFLTQDSDVIFSTTSGSHGITFQDESFQYSEPRWEFVEEVTGNDPLTITGLNGNEDDMYLIAFEVQANGGAEWGVRLNGSALNYQLHNLNSTSGTNGIHSDQNADWNLWQVPGDFGQGNGDQWFGEMVIWAKTGQKRYMIYHSLRNDGSNIEFEQGGGWWDDTTSNVTSIDFVNNFASGSTFRLYRRPR